MKKSNKEEFIKKSKIIHGNKYDYSNVEYINSKKKVKIICPEHGEFNQTPASHTIGSAGCPKCSRKNIKYKRSGVIDTETFIKKSKEIHGDKNLKKMLIKLMGKQILHLVK